MDFRPFAAGLSLALLSLPAFGAGKSPLAESPSAFVRAQADSGVRWHPWNEVTLAAAREADRSVYVFIGPAASELTRATITQTFASPPTVAWLNENFFCIFVDADDEPALASLAQHYLRTIKQLQGWPAHLWLTPELQPYDGANYLPPSEEWGKPGYLKSARSALETWTKDPARARALAEEAQEMMRLPPLETGAKIELAGKLQAATQAWIAARDPEHGGFGTAPKLPEPEAIRFLLAQGGKAREAALAAARAIVRGGLRDPQDGGFYRRTIDREWREPYFQKTLVDQARIALALYEAAEAANEEPLRAAATRALAFAVKELRHPDGSYAGLLDGTQEENADPARRPQFVKVGAASPFAQALLATALQRSGEKRLQEEATTLGTRVYQELFRPVGVRLEARRATAADFNALALMFRALQQDKLVEPLLRDARERFFDVTTGTYQAAALPLPAGIAFRAPLTGDTPSAEVLALLAGIEEKTADLIRRGLLSAIEYDEQPAGDVLLGLEATGNGR